MMTALKPIESWDVTAVSDHDEERKLLRKAVVSAVCCHPECDKPSEGAHHTFPRSFINSTSWFVRIPGEERPVLHVAGLCGSGTTGHHGDVEEHRAWIRYEDGVWNWYEQDGDDWSLAGPLEPQPGKQTVRKTRKRKKGEERKVRKTISLRVPAEAGEDGAGVLDDLIQTGRDIWADELGWSESVPPYYVIVAAFAKAFQ